MTEITPQHINNKENDTDILLFIRTLRKDIQEFDDYYVVIFKDRQNKKVGKMEFSKVKSKLQGELKILSSYDFKEIEEEINKYQSVRRSPIADISEYVKTLL